MRLSNHQRYGEEKKDEKKFKTLEKKRPNAMEMAKKAYEKRKEKTSQKIGAVE